MKKALIVGASGFCGQHLCRALSKKYEVVGTYHKATLPKNRSYKMVPLNVCDADQVYKLLKKFRPDFIYNLAGMSIPRLSWKNPKLVFDVNVTGNLYLLEASRMVVPKVRILLASSIQVYGKTFREGKPVSEKSFPWPESPYAYSKLVAEYACLNYVASYGMDIVIARPINHIGKGQSDQLVLSGWSRQIATAEKNKKASVLKVGNLNVYREFLHVDDVVKAYQVLMRKGKTGEIYNISLGKTCFLTKYVEYLVQQAHVPIRIEVEKKRMRLDDPKIISGNSRKLQRLGWKPSKTAFVALKEILEEWRGKV